MKALNNSSIYADLDPYSSQSSSDCYDELASHKSVLANIVVVSEVSLTFFVGCRKYSSSGQQPGNDLDGPLHGSWSTSYQPPKAGCPTLH